MSWAPLSLTLPRDLASFSPLHNAAALLLLLLGVAVLAPAAAAALAPSLPAAARNFLRGTGDEAAVAPALSYSLALLLAPLAFVFASRVACDAEAACGRLWRASRVPTRALEALCLALAVALPALQVARWLQGARVQQNVWPFASGASKHPLFDGFDEPIAFKLSLQALSLVSGIPPGVLVIAFSVIMALASFITGALALAILDNAQALFVPLVVTWCGCNGAFAAAGALGAPLPTTLFVRGYLAGGWEFLLERVTAAMKELVRGNAMAELSLHEGSLPVIVSAVIALAAAVAALNLLVDSALRLSGVRAYIVAKHRGSRHGASLAALFVARAVAAALVVLVLFATPLKAGRTPRTAGTATLGLRYEPLGGVTEVAAAHALAAALFFGAALPTVAETLAALRAVALKAEADVVPRDFALAKAAALALLAAELVLRTGTLDAVAGTLDEAVLAMVLPVELLPLEVRALARPSAYVSSYSDGIKFLAPCVAQMPWAFALGALVTSPKLDAVLASAAVIALAYGGRLPPAVLLGDNKAMSSWPVLLIVGAATAKAAWECGKVISRRIVPK